jgi:1-pyrroline-5-carboxylate dehydrogenase
MHCLAHVSAVAGRWTGAAQSKTIPDPMNGEAFVSYPDTQVSEIDHFVTSLNACPKSGLHNPFKNPER